MTTIKATEEAVQSVKPLWQVCPKCTGQGIVSKPPYIAGDQSAWSGSEAYYQCDVCKGKKILSIFTGIPPNDELNSPTNLEAIDCLQELMAMYMYNVDSNGEPKATIQEIVDLWKKARQVLNRAKNENIVAEGNYIQAINFNYCNCINSQLNIINGKYLCHL